MLFSNTYLDTNMIQYLILSIQLMEKYQELQLKVKKIFKKGSQTQNPQQDSPNVQEAEHRGLSQPRDPVVEDGHPSPLKKRRKIYKLEW